MGLISSGIEKVRVSELPGGIWADGSTVNLPRIALVKWQSYLSDKFYQIYVNGRFAGATFETNQRQMVVQMPTSFKSAVKIEVFAVEAEDVNTDFGNAFDFLFCDSGRVKIVLLREQSLPMGSVIQIYSNGGNGEVDYDNPINDTPIHVWAVQQDKAGFGLATFGESDFGYDSAAAIGFGEGIFGHGEFGVDADFIEWTSEELSGGIYKFGVKIIDEAGNESDNSETREITVTPGAKPAEQVGVSLFNKLTNQLVLSIS